MDPIQIPELNEIRLDKLSKHPSDTDLDQLNQPSTSNGIRASSPFSRLSTSPASFGSPGDGRSTSPENSDSDFELRPQILAKQIKLSTSPVDGNSGINVMPELRPLCINIFDQIVGSSEDEIVYVQQITTTNRDTGKTKRTKKKKMLIFIVTVIL